MTLFARRRARVVDGDRDSASSATLGRPRFTG